MIVESKKVLVCEDEEAIREFIVIHLKRSGYEVFDADCGEKAVDLWNSGLRFDVAVLDIMMPGLDGLEALKRARAAGVSSPVLFLTAKGEIEDRVAGLDAGADDYLPKPFATSEFVSRVKALTRRSGSYTPDIISLGETKLDLSGYTLSRGDRSVRLGNKEFQLMELFMRNRGRVFSTEYLMDKVWGLDSEAEIDVVWTYIGFLRKKLRQLDADVEIKTIRGAGYALEES